MLSPDHSFVVPSISRDMRSVFDAHFAFVWRYMAHRGVPTASIDDLVHNVFRIVREHPSRHDPARSRCVLVCMIARQVLREFRKRHASLAQKPDTSADLEIDGATQNFSRNAAVQMLDAVLERLTEMQREVILLCDGEKLSARDVGDALGLPESTVELRLDSARRNLETLVGRLRTHPLWDSLGTASRDAGALLDAAQLARTPTDRDRERVFAAMLASSMTSRTGTPDMGAMTGEVPVLPRPMQLPTPSPSLLINPLPTPVQPNAHRVPKPPRRRTGLMWGAAVLAGMTIGVASYAFVASTRTQAKSEDLAAPVTITAHVEEPAAPAVAAAPEQPGEEAPVAAPGGGEPTTLVAVAEAPSQEALQPTNEAGAPGKADAEQAAPPRDNAAKRKARTVRPPRPQQRTGSEEARQLFAAERAFKAGETQLALEMIDNLEKLYPESPLGTDRSALRAQILCETGRTRAARRIVLELEAAQVDKPVLAAVDQACMHR